jgi:hypothetical protein
MRHLRASLLAVAAIAASAARTGAALARRRQGDRARQIVEIAAERSPASRRPRSRRRRARRWRSRLRSDDTAHGFRIVGTTSTLELPKRGPGAWPR